MYEWFFSLHCHFQYALSLCNVIKMHLAYEFTNTLIITLFKGKKRRRKLSFIYFELEFEVFLLFIRILKIKQWQNFSLKFYVQTLMMPISVSKQENINKICHKIKADFGQIWQNNMTLNVNKPLQTGCFLLFLIVFMGSYCIKCSSLWSQFYDLSFHKFMTH